MTNESSSTTSAKPLVSARKAAVTREADQAASLRDAWIERNASYYEDDYAFMRFLVSSGSRVLDLGCGTGRLLADLQPSYGVGVDISGEMVAVARANYPELEFVVGDIEDESVLASLTGPFDYIILSDTLGYVDDCLTLLDKLHPLCSPNTRLILAGHSHLWEPVLNMATRIGQRMPLSEHYINWLSMGDIAGILHLADFEVLKYEWRQLLPVRLFGLGPLLNKILAPIPLARNLCLRRYMVARPYRRQEIRSPSCTVVVPCRNERGNIENAIKRTPRFCSDLEFIFIEGHSKDGTWEEILRVKDAYPDIDIKAMRQTGKGKGNAVREAFAAARGDVLMILDADLTVPPEDLPKFYTMIANGKGEFINGTRFTYTMEDEAMRFLNYWANRTFAKIFSYLLGCTFTDTLCGTKVLMREAYQRIDDGRSFFGDFDPFGDFDLIFGASKLNLAMIEVPIRYASRQYGTTQISRFRHGWLLLKMVVFAYRKLKLVNSRR